MASTGSAEPARLRVLLVRHGQSLNNVLMAESHALYDKRRVADAPLTACGEVQARVTGAFLAEYFRRRPAGRLTLYTSAFARAIHTASHIAAAMRVSPVLWTAVHETGGIYEHVYDDAGALMDYRGVGGLTLNKMNELFTLVRLPDADDALHHPGVAADIDDAGWWHSPAREKPAEAEIRVQGVVRLLRSWAAALVDSSHAATHQLDGMPAAAGVDVPGGVTEMDIAPAEHTRPAALSAYDDSVSRATGRVETIIIVCHGDFIDTFMRVLFGGASAMASEHMQVCHYNCGISWLDFYADGGVRLVRVNDASHLQYSAIPDRLGFDTLLTGGPV